MSHRIALIVVILSHALLLGGCSAFWSGHESRTGVSSSLVDYLYPDGQIPPAVDNRAAHLELPIRVGLAFVPQTRGMHPLPESRRIELLKRVGDAFADEPFIESIDVIPESYMRSTAGVSGMQQVARLYGVDVLALVSYDQVGATADNAGSLLYWTIVGAYVLPGTENRVHTFVDTAVFEVASATLLFRAPGTDERDSLSTAVGASTAAWTNANGSFAAAMENMGGNLATELDGFEERVLDGAASATVSYREGYSGGGSMGWLLVMLLIGIVVGRLSYRYTKTDITRESQGGGLFMIVLASLPLMSLLTACGGGSGDGGGNTEMTSPPDPAANGASGDLCNLALLFLADPNSVCTTRSSSSPSATPPAVPSPPRSGSISILGNVEFEPNNDPINANVMAFASGAGQVGFYVDGTVDDQGDIHDHFGFVRSRGAGYRLQLCPPDEMICEQSMPIDTGTAFFEILDQDGRVLVSSADAGSNRIVFQIDAGISYTIRVVAGDTMGSPVGYRLTAYESDPA